MNRRSFEHLVEQAIGSIPRIFLDQVENLSFQVEDWADSEALEDAGFREPRELLGLYQGWPLDQRTHEYGNCLPDVILIYQGAMEDYHRETGIPLEQIVRETIIHELAHYFGFDEESMDEIEDLWAASSKDGNEDKGNSP